MSLKATSPLKLYWWNDMPNFGDALSPLILGYVAGRKVEWAAASECEIFSLGSIMRLVRRSHSTSQREKKPWIWGTGSMGPHRIDFIPNVRFAAVRGHITSSLLGLSEVVVGDPGLLVREALDIEVPRVKKYKVGFVLHHTRATPPEIERILKEDTHTKKIDSVTRDAISVVNAISKCELIVSSSLHGMVVADSLGIPNIWLDPTGIHGTPRFKFYDYAGSIGRFLADPVPASHISEAISKGDDLNTDYQNNISVVNERLKQAFPAELMR